MNPFEYVKAINKGNRSFMNSEEAIKAYNAFIVNRSFSLFPDTMMDANIMNSAWHLPAKLQFDYYTHSILPGSRFGKWHKKDAKLEEDIRFLMDLFEYSRKKVLDSWEILEPQLEMLRQRYTKHESYTK